MLERTAPSMLRQTWLHNAEQELRKLFLEKGYKVPAEVRTSIGFPKGSRDGKVAIGQCWALESSTDKHSEIFVSPELGHEGKGSVAGSIRILYVLAHEYGHAIAGNKAGHRIVKKPAEPAGKSTAKYERALEKWRNSFPAVVGSVGLVVPWTTIPQDMPPEFTAWAKPIIAKIDTFPAGALTNFNRKKDTNRQLKCECDTCGYIARTTKKWITDVGPPTCGVRSHGVMMCEEVEEGDE